VILRPIFEKHPHWQDILGVIHKMDKAGHTIYLVGGCVRDALLGVQAFDFDLASSATPDEVKNVFKNALDIGKKFGVSIIPMKSLRLNEHFQVEITTFRNDLAYTDGRHPEKIVFGTVKEDAFRRDFTINALFYDLKKDQVLDYVNGLNDLHKRVIRTVNDPIERFQEDKLRMLRAARFAAQLNFKIDESTYVAMKKLSPEIKVISKERITQEFKKMLKTEHCLTGLNILKETGLLAEIWPGLNLASHWKKLEHLVFSFNPVTAFDYFIAICLILDSLKSTTIAICLILDSLKSTTNGSAHSDVNDSPQKVNWKNLPFIISNEEKKRIEFLITGFYNIKDQAVDALLLLNEEDGPLLSEFCFILGTQKLIEPELIDKLIESYLKVCNEKGFLPEPLLNGAEVMSLGFKPSSLLGEILKKMYLAQIKDEIKNKADAREWVVSRYQK
jgi:tRNA nucleotidyltransferase/poly(A) polymerase